MIKKRHNMWKIQSDELNKWYYAEQWQIEMINETITSKQNFYAKHTHKKKIYTNVCTHDKQGNIILWNLTTNTIRIVIHSDYGTPYHNGPKSGGGMCIDHLEMANQLPFPLPIV
jgi:hypothetical protein